jgi:signal transduction histidine kinase
VADSEAKAKEQSLTAETNARQGIRRELHDGAAAIMAAARWSFEAKIEQLEAENNPLAADLRTNLELQNRAYQALRNAIHRTEQDPVSWVDELRLFCNPLPGVNLIEYNLEEVPNGQFGRKCLNMTRELIANALKYARASKIEVQLARLDDELLSITVSDNGEGFDVKTIPVLQQRTDASVDATLPVENLPEVGAHGLDNVHRYVFELGGDIEVTSQLGEGTNVVIELPLPKPTL